MKKVLGIMLAVAFVVVAVSVMAKEKAAPKEKGEKAAMAELTLTGKIAKGEAAGSFVLVDADGNKIELPKPKAAKGDEKPINLEEFVDQQVTLEAKGDKKVPTVKQIVSVEKVAAAGDAKPADAKAPAAGGEVK